MRTPSCNKPRKERQTAQQDRIWLEAASHDHGVEVAMPLSFIGSMAHKASLKSTLQTAEVMTLLKEAALRSTPA